MEDLFGSSEGESDCELTMMSPPPGQQQPKPEDIISLDDDEEKKTNDSDDDDDDDGDAGMNADFLEADDDDDSRGNPWETSLEESPPDAAGQSKVRRVMPDHVSFWLFRK